MRVLFDHQVFSWQLYGGISRYVVEIARGLKEIGHEPVFPAHFYSDNVYLPSIAEVRTKTLTPFPFKGKKWLQEQLGRTASLRAIRTSHADVFHPTYFGDYFLNATQEKKIPFVITIHDMIHEKYGHGSRSFFSLDAKVVENKRLLAQKADAIIVVSENTKRDVLHYIPGVDPAKIHTIHHGNSLRPPEVSRQNQLVLPDRFLLFVGQRRAYKNFDWMLEQLADTLRNDKTMHLVCAGGAPFDEAEQAKISALGIQKKILHPKIHSDSDLSELYARAQCFIFPSKYEGFGMPVLEAFACGCPVILNNVSSLPEVGGDAALYFNDGDGNMLARNIALVLKDAVIKEKLIEKGTKRVQQFTWHNSVVAHLKVYQSIIENV